MGMKWYGKAGSSMSTSSFQSKYADTSQSGRAGEVRLESLLKRITDGETIGFSSVRTPKQGYNTDVDFVLVKGNRVLLIDSKLYKQGGFWFSFGGKLFRNFIPAHRDKAGNHKAMSRNMSMARDAFREKLGNDFIVEAVTVFVRSDDNKPHANTWFTRFPGGIKTLNEASLGGYVHRFFRGARNDRRTAQAESFVASITPSGNKNSGYRRNRRPAGV